MRTRFMTGTTTIQRVEGMGATVQQGGVGLRVWAPNADRVSVGGEFNNWDPDAHPLEAEEHGKWACLVENAAPGESISST